MDTQELSERAQALPDRFAGRFDADQLREIRGILGEGEWDVGLDILASVLTTSAAPVSPEERDELAALLSALGDPTDRLSRLDELNVTA